MQNRSRRLLVYLLCTLCLCRCANIGNPEGGPRDTTPPIIQIDESTPNLQRNFNPVTLDEPIIIKFNEWVKLEDAFKQVVISPPLVYAPKIELKGKGVSVKLDPREVLKENTTYTINFGKAIKDITENLPARNLRFVFSTGPIIDTAFIAGKLIDAITGETKEDQVIMLYTSDADSVIYKQRPIYFSRSDERGNFIIQNIKDTTYKIFALEDANSNYFYDQDKERIAFLDRRVAPGEDTTTLVLRYYTSFVRPRIINFNTETAGLIKLQTNYPVEELVLKTERPGIELFSMKVMDTVMIYYHPDSIRDWALEVNFLDRPIDTILVNRIRRTSSDSFRLVQPRNQVNEIAPDGQLELSFNQPVGQIDTTLISFIDDTTLKPVSFRMIKSALNHQVYFECDCIEQQTYSLTILPGAILNYKSNGMDTLKMKLKGINSAIAGTLMVEVNDLDSTQQYIFQLKVDDRIIATDSINNHAQFTKTYRYLNPATYSIQIIEDKNRNHRWDPGNYPNKTLPEKIVIEKNISVRANWELRTQISWINKL